MIDRRDFLQLSGGSLVLAAAGCSRSRLADPDAVLRLTYPLESWDFRFRDDSTEFLLFLPLVARGPTGALEPRLAPSWEHSRDFRTWTIRIRDDVFWHDGEPVTAHDIEVRLDLLTHPEIDRIHRSLHPIFEADLPVVYLYPDVESSIRAPSSSRDDGQSSR